MLKKIKFLVRRRNPKVLAKDVKPFLTGCVCPGDQCRARSLTEGWVSQDDVVLLTNGGDKTILSHYWRVVRCIRWADAVQEEVHCRQASHLGNQFRAVDSVQSKMSLLCPGQ